MFKHTRDVCRQPAAEVLDLGRVGAAQANPGFLNSVVRLAQRTQHTGHRPAPQVRAVLLEARREPITILLGQSSSPPLLDGVTVETHGM